MADRFTKNYGGERHKGWRVGTLWCANWDVDGDVSLSSDFDNFNDTAKIDILSDFIGLLTRERDTLLEKVPDHIRQVMGWPENDETNKPQLTTIVVRNNNHGTTD